MMPGFLASARPTRVRGAFRNDHRCTQLLDPDAASTHRQILPQTWRKIEIRTQNEGKPPISREKTHVMHQIGIDVAAETNPVLEITL